MPRPKIKIMGTTINALKCPCCGGHMTYRAITDTKNTRENEGLITHVWSCNDCPVVLFEHYDKVDSRRVKEFLDYDWLRDQKEEQDE